MTFSFRCLVILYVTLIMMQPVFTKESNISMGYEDDHNVRTKRDCGQDQVMTLQSWINLIKHIENHKDVSDNSAKQVAHYLRKEIDKSLIESAFLRFLRVSDYFCEQYGGNLPSSILDKAQNNHLQKLMFHERGVTDDKVFWESGVLLTPNGETVAVGHVITGISCGGFGRDTNVLLDRGLILTSHPLDNLFVVTLAGDVGQTVLEKYENLTGDYFERMKAVLGNSYEQPLLGPDGEWNSHSCPTNYILSTIPSGLTKAEVLGDIDGIILGMIMTQSDIKGLKLSTILENYYGLTGLGPNGIFKASNRIANYKMAVQDETITKQSLSFFEAFALLNRKFKARSKHRNKIPGTVSVMHKTYMTMTECENHIESKYTMNNVINIIKMVEDTVENKRHNLKEMTQHIMGLMPQKIEYFQKYVPVRTEYKATDGFFWTVLRDLITHEMVNVGIIPQNRLREIGVLIDPQLDTLGIANVLAGIATSKDGSNKRKLYGSTVAGILASAAIQKEKQKKRDNVIGPEGKWTKDCPPQHLLYKKDIDKVPVAQVRGAMDGFILGHFESDVKLSQLLEQYYSKTGLIKDTSVSYLQRSEKFKDLYGGTTTLVQEVTKSCKDFSWFGETKCSQLGQDVVSEFEEKLLSQDPERKISTNLPDYDILENGYKGYRNRHKGSTNNDIKRMIGEAANTADITKTDGLRISLLLNQLGHTIPRHSTGAIIGSDGKTYIYDVAVLETYLSERYGLPNIAESTTQFANDRGILVLDSSIGKMIGLWNGSNLYEMEDLTTGLARSLKLWKANDCEWLAKYADCRFYKCVDEHILRCGNDGYAIGYGERYCNRFSHYLEDFTEDGKKWVGNVRRCLMKILLPMVKSIRSQSKSTPASCDMIKEFAFKSHPKCYTDGEPNFCDVFSDMRNWDALFKVFEFSDFFADDWKLALGQILETAKICTTSSIKTIVDSIIKSGKQLFPNNQIDAGDKRKKRELDTNCEHMAHSGDCRFYECFERKFPCHDKYGVSHILNFELVNCKKLETQKAMMTSQGKSWFIASQRCLMEDLLTLYQERSVNCASLSLRMLDKREQCYIDNGFCDVLNSSPDKFSVDRAMNVQGFPRTTESLTMATSSILDISVTIGSYYYQKAIFLKRLTGTYATLCHQRGLRNSPHLYQLQSTDHCEQEDCMLKMDVTNE